MRLKPLYIFTVREAYLLTGASMFLGLFVSLLFQGLLGERLDTALLERLIVLFGELAILIPAILILRQRGIKFMQILILKPVSFVTIGMAIGLVLGTIGIISAFEVIVLPYFPLPDYLKQLESDLIQTSFSVNLVLILAAGLAAPLVEEFIFRGVLQQSLFYRHASILPAMVIPTVIFALFHVAYLFYLPALIELIALALLLSWLTIKTGNILVPILVHGIFNLSSFTEVLTGELEKASSLSELGIPWIILSLILFVIGWFYFKHMPVTVFDDVYLIPPAQAEEK